MRAGTARELPAMCSIVAHFGRPGTPTDQAWIETLFGHVKGEWPHLEKIRDPAVLAAELEVVRADYNGRRLSLGVDEVLHIVAPSRRLAAPATRLCGCRARGYLLQTLWEQALEGAAAERRCLACGHATPVVHEAVRSQARRAGVRA